MELGMSRTMKSKEKYVRISMKEIWRNLDGPPKNIFFYFMLYDAIFKQKYLFVI